uniref:Unspecific monooxygenase n=1 Tax=Panagrolaimus sp. ES5 TaxID=591445 RepID=A0AC34FJ33_9BILA
MENILPSFRKKYGDLFTIWYGEKPFVLFTTFESISENFIKNGEAFSGREKNEMFLELLRDGHHGMMLTDGPIWKEHRRFTMQFLRTFNLGKLMQQKILNEVSWMLNDLKKQVKAGENEISIQKSLDVAVGSVINSIVFGSSFDEKSLNDFYATKAVLKRGSRMISNLAFKVMLRDPYQIVRRLPYFNGIFAEVKGVMDEIKIFFYEKINERRLTINFNEDSEPSDYVEAYLRQQKKLNDSGDKGHSYTDKQLFGNVFDLWLAGQESTAYTLAWIVLYLMTDLKAQKKLHAELTKVIDSDRFITHEDKINLPYLNAVIAESQRLGNLLVNNIPRRLTSDVTYHGYTLKKDTIVVPEISQVLYDEKIFPEPHKFLPERFLDSDGKFQTKPELIPFSIGKRACLGESMARAELYLFTANLFNHFEITNVKSKPANTTRVMGSAVQPEPFVCQLKERF